MSITWTNCFSAHRFGTSSSSSGSRSDYEHDYDRLIFSSAFRRLQNKTQVFPLPGHIFVHNRLTHSLEVASVGRSLGKTVGKSLTELPEIKNHSDATYFYSHHLKDVISSACLAHDLGNPAFGHSGEEAISQFFIQNASSLIYGTQLRSYFSEHEWQDLVNFEGNANTLRLLTRQFNGRLPGGNFRLTLSTLASTIKYPCAAYQTDRSSGKIHLKKYGYFQAERDIFLDIAKATNMRPTEEGADTYYRHPFVLLVEAADDICYNVIDFEDAQRLGILTHDYVKDMLTRIVLLNKNEDQRRFLSNLRALSADPNEQITYLRAKSINYLTQRCAQVFLDKLPALVSGEFNSSLIQEIQEFESLYSELRKVSFEKVYSHEKVVKVEVTGFKIMSGLLEDFIPAVLSSEPSAKDKKVLKLIPNQFKHQESMTAYERCLCVLDFISGMTDLYALELYQNLRGIRLPSL